MPRLLAAGTVALTVLSLGCAGGSDPAAPPAPLPAGTALGGSLVSTHGLVEAPLALWRLDIDPASLSATSELLASRALAQTDDVYLLPVDQFFADGDFRV